MSSVVLWLFFVFVSYLFMYRLGTKTILKVSIWHRYHKNPNDTQP